MVLDEFKIPPSKTSRGQHGHLTGACHFVVRSFRHSGAEAAITPARSSGVGMGYAFRLSP